MFDLDASPIHTITFQNRKFFVKRDDLLSPTFSGNKARKFYYLLKNHFPEVRKLIGYGSPQANSLYSLSELAKLKKWQLDFYVDHIPNFLLEDPSGNYREALNNGANIIPIGSIKKKPSAKNSTQEYIEKNILQNEHDFLFLPEGGRSQLAELGIEKLANEINSWAKMENINNLKVALPSGTGTTALFLQKHVPYEVLTCACVGGKDYLKQQFFELSNNENEHPTILSTTESKKEKYHFGKLYNEFFEIWQTLKEQTQIEFDLLYDPLGWLTLMNYINGPTSKLSEKTDILYIHQGGLLGNETMLARYKRKNRQIALSSKG